MLIRDHIELFPVKEDSSKAVKYLDACPNLTIIHNMFKDKQPDVIASKSHYINISNNHYSF